MMNRYNKTGINIIIRTILFLSVSGIMFIIASQDVGIAFKSEDALLNTMTIYMSSPCPDTLVVKNITFHVRREPWSGLVLDCGLSRGTWLRLNDTDTLSILCNRMASWKKGDVKYRAFVDSVSWEKLHREIRAFENSPNSCLRNYYYSGDTYHLRDSLSNNGEK